MDRRRGKRRKNNGYTKYELDLIQATKTENRALKSVEVVARDTVRLQTLLESEKARTGAAKMEKAKLAASIAKMKAVSEKLDTEHAEMERKQTALERELKALATKLDVKMRHHLAALEKKLSFKQTSELAKIRRQGASHADALRTSDDSLGALKSKVRDAIELLATLRATRTDLESRIQDFRHRRRDTGDNTNERSE